MQFFIHYFLHLGFPLIIAYAFFRENWKNVYLILLLTMIIDVDHVFSEPIFQANRCSINYHMFHTHYAAVGYVVLLFLRKPFNIIGLGLVLHLATDFVDCIMTYQKCTDCIIDGSLLQFFKIIST